MQESYLSDLQIRTIRDGQESRWRYLPAVAVLTIATVLFLYALLCSIRWVGTVFPGFLMMPNGVVTTVSTFGWPPDRAALFHGQVVAVEGTPVHDSAEVYRLVAAAPSATELRYTLFRDGHTTTVRVPSVRFSFLDYIQTYGLILGVGITYLLLGVAVGFLQPAGLQARVFLGQAVVAGLYPITGIFLHSPDTPTLARVNLIFESFFGATWIHLALVFPLERELGGWRRWVPVLPYAASTILAWLVLDGVFDDPPRLTALHATYSYHAFSIVFFLAAIAYATWEDRQPIARLRIKAVFPGLLAASVLPFFAFLNNALGGGDFPVQFALLPIPLLQASLAYAIAKHDLFDTDRIVRRSFVYSVLSLIVLTTYALVLVLAAEAWPSSGITSETIVTGVFVLVLALVLDPLRRGVQTAVDRAFFRARVQYRATLQDLSAAMTTLLDLGEIAAQTTRVVADAMQLEWATLRVRQQDGWFHRSWTAGGSASQMQDAPQESEASLSLPLQFRSNEIGVLVLGPKRSGRGFGRDDLSMLRTLANQTAIAVHNALSYAALEDLNRSLDAQVQEQTEALRRSNADLLQAFTDLRSTQAQLLQNEKLASLGRLVAGVAHELNNPASFVHGGLGTLADYTERLCTAVQAYESAAAANPELAARLGAIRAQYRIDYVLRESPALLRICGEGSERIRKIIEELRIFARAEDSERELLSLEDSLEGCLRLLGHRRAAAGARVEKAYASVAWVRANGGQLAQVWMNLLGNALDAVEGRPNPWVRIAIHAATQEASGVTVEIRDNGPGIAPELRDKVFEPFFTTKPVGKGTGLGLSIAYGAVKSLGGTISIDDPGGDGTAVRVWLPCA